jgi:uncharacterized protein (DUF433 family)
MTSKGRHGPGRVFVLNAGQIVIVVEEEHTDTTSFSDYVVVDDNIMGGEPVIRGTRIPTYLIRELTEDGISAEHIVSDHYPWLTIEQVNAALDFEELSKESRKSSGIREVSIDTQYSESFASFSPLLEAFHS